MSQAHSKDWVPDVSDWDILTDEKALSARRRSAESKLKNLTSDEILYLRKRAKTDLFFLTYSLLEYQLLSEGLHGHYAKWLQQNWGARYRLTLLPRDHYKSTENTVSDSVQMALPNDAGVTAHPYCLGPNIKLLLSHENRESASRFLYEITAAFMEKPLMLALFPDCIPSKGKQRINKWELDLPRTDHHKEPTFDTIGVNGAAQGRHFNWLKLDDLVGEEARDSELVMKRVLMWFDNINSLLTRLKIDGWDLTGTRWSALDVYSHAMGNYGINEAKSFIPAIPQVDREKLVREDGQLIVYARSALENGLPIFPEEFSLEDLNRIRKNPIVWAAQYANNPRESGLTGLQPHWLKFYNLSGDGQKIVVFAGDNTWSVRIRDLDILILIDPAMAEGSKSDHCGIVVTGTDRKMNVYILEAFKDRLKPPQLLDKMFQLYVRWHPRLISIEEVAFSGIYKYWFRERCQKLGVYPSIHEYKRPGGRNAKTKKEYIKAIAPYAAAGQIYALEGMHQLRDEWDWFPLGDSEHILDALSQGPSIWAAGSEQKTEKTHETAMEKLQEFRDALTGY